MSQESSEARFDKARKRLSSALKELEEITKEKIHEASEQQIKIISDNKDGDEAGLGGRYSLPAYNLSTQVNQLQNELSEVGKEVEFQREKNKTLLDRIQNFQQEKTHLAEAIERDIIEIERIIKSGGDDDC